MFRQELVRFGGDEAAAASWEHPVRSLDSLTPGDFAVAARQFEMWGASATPEKFHDLLCKECGAKGPILRKIGFCARI